MLVAFGTLHGSPDLANVPWPDIGTHAAHATCKDTSSAVAAVGHAEASADPWRTRDGVS